MARAPFILIVVAAACSPTPEPKASSGAGDDAASGAPKGEGRPLAASAKADGSDTAGDGGATAAEDAEPAEPAYRDPPPVVVRRHHVFATLNARAGKRVTLTSLLTTSADDHSDLAAGTEATLQVKPKGKAEWTAVANVKVVSITSKGNRVAGTERQEIAVEILSEEAGTKALWVRGAKLRLQVDRPETP